MCGPQVRVGGLKACTRDRTLHPLQPGVETVAREQLVVCAALDDAALVHHQDDVGFLNRRHAVRDHERRPAGHQAVESFEHQPLRFRVES